MNDNYCLELQKIAGGALQELFANDLERVLENIHDKNTSFKKARKITIELKFTPADESREVVLVNVNTKPILAPVQGVTTKVMVDKNGNKFMAAEFGDKMKGQMLLTDLEDNETSEEDNGEHIAENNNVRPLFKAK